MKCIASTHVEIRECVASYCNWYLLQIMSKPEKCPIYYANAQREYSREEHWLQKETQTPVASGSIKLSRKQASSKCKRMQ